MTESLYPESTSVDSPGEAGSSGSLAEVVKLFLRLGATGFGGPAALIGLMHDEVVVRRKWLKDEEFMDLIGATNLIPGPNSTEMAMHIGYIRAGWRGLIAGGLCFLAPAFLIVLALAWVYVRYGCTPEAGWLLYGIKPVVIAIIFQALWSLSRKAIKSIPLAIVGTATVILYFAGMNELVLLFLSGLVIMVSVNRKLFSGHAASTIFLPLGVGAAAAGAATSFSLTALFLYLLKIGAVWYGSGYVLLAFLRSDFVERLGWLTDHQLIDAVTVSQVTPGPLLTAATFIGYLLGGTVGAVVATVGICLPSFVFVAVSNPLIPRLRRSKFAGPFLDGVNVAALGLMAVVTWQLGRASIVDPVTAILLALSIALLLRYRISSVWLIAGGAAAGLVRTWLG